VQVLPVHDSVPVDGVTVPVPSPPLVLTVSVSLSRALPVSDATVVPPTAAVARSVAVREPNVAGAKTTMTAQLAPAASGCEQALPTTMKSAALVPASDAVIGLVASPPVFVSMNIRGAPVVATS
jgi:hypothetical protein